MFSVTRKGSPFLIAIVVLTLCSLTWGEDAKIRIPLPRRSHPTPVQKYNQDGVKEVKKHNYKEAKKLFYKAYLLDPNDPFTLNNLGYVAELEGDVDRAQRFYELAQESGSEAVVYKASDPDIEGKTLASVAGHAEPGAMKVNLINVQALSLLQKDRAPEADLLLQKALQVDPKNPFTLNNMGFAKEKEGELEQAVKFYTAAARTNAKDPVVVALKSDWRGKPIGEIAASNAKKTQKQLQKENTPEMRLARLNLRGVSALNRNDRKAARQYFQQAYRLDQNDAFALNNMGYLSELDGDKESADAFYAAAKKADRSNEKVGVATKRDAEGQPLVQVADNNSGLVDQRMEVQQQMRRRQGGTPSLIMRRPGAGEDRPPADQDTTPNPDDDNPVVNSNGAAIPQRDQPQGDNAQQQSQPSQIQEGAQPGQAQQGAQQGTSSTQPAGEAQGQAANGAAAQQPSATSPQQPTNGTAPANGAAQSGTQAQQPPGQAPAQQPNEKVPPNSQQPNGQPNTQGNVTQPSQQQTQQPNGTQQAPPTATQQTTVPKR